MDVNPYCLEVYARSVLDAARATARREALASAARPARPALASVLAAAWRRALRAPAAASASAKPTAARA